MMVNEDVENRVINLAVRTTRITAGDLYKALRAYMRHIQNKKQLRQAAKDSVIRKIPLRRAPQARRRGQTARMEEKVT